MHRHILHVYTNRRTNPTNLAPLSFSLGGIRTHDLQLWGRWVNYEGHQKNLDRSLTLQYQNAGPTNHCDWCTARIPFVGRCLVSKRSQCDTLETVCRQILTDHDEKFNTSTHSILGSFSSTYIVVALVIPFEYNEPLLSIHIVRVHSCRAR